MTFDIVGPAWPDQGWTPAPRYLLRRARVLQLVELLPRPSHVIDIGCGPGALLRELMADGVTCEGVETSLPAIGMASEIDAAEGRKLLIHGDADQCDSADLMLAMEVLEHVHDDSTALRHWLQKLKPGGHIIISVPAHQHRWGPSDVWAGHVRRYEKSDIALLCVNSGLELVKLENYGFPAANALDVLTRPYYRKKLAEDAFAENCADLASRTANSGTDRRASRRAAPFLTSRIGRLIFHSALLTQAAFCRFDLGPGYIALARKS